MTREQAIAEAEIRELIAQNRRLRLLLLELRALQNAPLDGLGLAELLAHRERLVGIQRAAEGAKGAPPRPAAPISAEVH